MTLSIADFKKIELKAAKIIEVNEHPNADRLWMLKIDIGNENPSQIVAGIREHYSKEELIGKTIIVCANLEPAVIRGVKSEGMLLAAKSGQYLSVATLEKDIPPGTIIS